MNKQYKCPVCGCEKHFKLQAHEIRDEKGNRIAPGLIIFKNSLYVYGDAKLEGEVDMRLNATPYICAKCGHIDLFSEGLLQEYEKLRAEAEDAIKQIDDEVKQAKLQIEAAGKEKETDMKRLNEVNKILKSDEITVKQQRELQKEKAVLKARISGDYGVAKLNNLLIDKQRELDNWHQRFAYFEE